MPQKVVFIGPAYPYRGGIAAFNENLATIFQTNGWECNMLTFNEQNSARKLGELTTEDPRPNLTIKRGIYSTNPLNWLKMSKEIVSQKPDLVITQYWMPYMAPAFGTILRGVKKELPNVKIATIVHNFKPDQSRIGDMQLNKYITNRTDLIFCMSETVKQEIEETVKNKPVINLFHPIYDHYGTKMDITKAKLSLGWDFSTKYLLFFGEVKVYKGLDLLIEALALLRKNLDYKLYVAGKFAVSEEKINKLIAHHDLEEKVIIKSGYVPNDDVPRLFCGASAVITPYKTITQSGIIPVALHFERPVIVTKAGNLSDKIKQHQLGYLAEPNAAALAQQIDRFLNEKTALKSDYTSIKEELSWQSFFNIFIKEVNHYYAESV